MRNCFFPDGPIVFTSVAGASWDDSFNLRHIFVKSDDILLWRLSRRIIATRFVFFFLAFLLYQAYLSLFTSFFLCSPYGGRPYLVSGCIDPVLSVKHNKLKIVLVKIILKSLLKIEPKINHHPKFGSMVNQ